MLFEEQRYIHEDLERLEQGIADRMRDEPKHVHLPSTPANPHLSGGHLPANLHSPHPHCQIRDRLNRDHEVSQLLDQIQKQSAELLSLYQDKTEQRSRELLQIGAGDTFDEFYRQVNEVREHHARYPNEQAENSETWYRPQRDENRPFVVESMFSGEEAYGRFFDLHVCHEHYLNLPNVKRLAYMQYLDVFDNFQPGYGGVKRADKLTDQYFKYLGELMTYLESFMARTRPLENLDRVFAGWDRDFDAAWQSDEVQGWQRDKSAAATKTDSAGRTLSTADAVWCEACEKEFKNQNVYSGHLGGRKHVKAAEVLAAVKGSSDEPEAAKQSSSSSSSSLTFRLRERAVAEREYRIKKLASAMSTERDDTRVNVERRQGMTERERAQELENFFNLAADSAAHGHGGAGGDGDEDEEDGDDKIYNPLKLPLAWDGKPIPFWLYRLHGLGQEFPCEICGNFVYRGRRAFDKHFNETNHITNLKRLGITNTHLFRDITSIEEAMKLWDKIQREQKRGTVDDGSIVQMEDAEGNVMPEKVYLDLQKQGLL